VALGRHNISVEYFYALARRVLGDALINYNPFARVCAEYPCTENEKGP